MLFIGVSNELGEFESGLTAQWIGTVPATLRSSTDRLVVTDSLWLLQFWVC